MPDDTLPFSGRTITFVHTLPALEPVFDALLAEELPGATARHIIDSGFYDAEFEAGELNADEQRRLIGYLNEDDAAGSAASVVTCSFLGTYVDKLRPEARTNWLRIDEAMGRAALEEGDRLGILSTGDAASASTRGLFERLARETGHELRIETRVIPEAFEARLSGDLAAHDRMIADAIHHLQHEVDAIVLSQASMARAVESMTAAPLVRVLTSPPFLFAQLRAALSN